jgi:hypothetical protein
MLSLLTPRVYCHCRTAATARAQETDYQNWAQGEPNDWSELDGSSCGGGENGEDCVIIFETCPVGQCRGEDGSAQTGERGFWNDAQCHGTHPYVCGFA